MNPISAQWACLLAATALLGGCGRGNGLPGDLAAHLSSQGISIRPVRTHAPLSRRDGYLVAKHDPEAAAKIVSTFKLEKITADDHRFQIAVDRAGGLTTVKEVWGASGRPSQFRLKNGGQFEYFHLVITTDGWMYLVAEYAYG
jgi:hypothetical protein